MVAVREMSLSIADLLTFSDRVVTLITDFLSPPMKRIVLAATIPIFLVGAGSGPVSDASLNQAFGQEAARRQDSPASRAIFQRVERGITAGDVAVFSRDFGPQVVINLHGGESGSFSSGQAHYVLETYCRPRKFGHFSFTTVDEAGGSPYATGSVTFNFRGRRELAQVYVSLSLAGDRWVISQFNIY